MTTSIKPGLSVRRVLPATVAVLLTALAVSDAWAGTGNASGYYVISDGGCTLNDAGDICSWSFTPPAKTIVGEYTVLQFGVACDDLGSGVDFGVQARINGVSVKTLTYANAINRGMWEDVAGGVLVAGASNLLEFIATGPATGSCTIQDVNLTYRLSTAP
jgi:hypothetical protein